MSSSRGIGTGRPGRVRGWSPVFTGFLLVASLVPIGAALAGIAIPREEMAARYYDPGQSAGLFVGIRRFDGFSDVPYAVDDAVDLAHIFVFELALLVPENVTLLLGGEPQSQESRGFRDDLQAAGATVLSSADKSEIYRHLSQQGGRTGRRGMLLAFVATHGFSEGGNDFLVASDSFEADIAGTGIPVAKLFEYVASATTPRRLILIDACRERLAPSRSVRDEPMSLSFAKAIEETRGQVAMSATVAGGFAYDDDGEQNGVFSAAILRGLRGEAEADESNLITVQTLADYVDEEVRRWVRIYRPQDVLRSTGIAVTSGEWRAINLPLAVHPERSAEAYRRRVEGARRILAASLGQGGEVIEGNLFNTILAALDTERPCPAHKALLAKIEVLAQPLSVDEPFAAEIRQGLQRNLLEFFHKSFPKALRDSVCTDGTESTPSLSAEEEPNVDWEPPPSPAPQPPAGEELAEDLKFPQSPPPQPPDDEAQGEGTEPPAPPPPPPPPVLPRVSDGPALELSAAAGEIGPGLTFWRPQEENGAELFSWRNGEERLVGRLAGHFRSIRLSPRTRYLVAVDKKKQIYLYDLRQAVAGDHIAPRLLHNAGLHPVWSSDGGQLAWVAVDPKRGYELVTTRVQGRYRQRRNVVYKTWKAPQSLAWETSGGRRLALSVRDGGRHKTVLVPATGSATSNEAVELLAADLAKNAFSVSPQWSVSGASLYFTSDFEGSWAVYQVFPQPGSPVRRPGKVPLPEEYQESYVMSVSGSRQLALLTFGGTIAVYDAGSRKIQPVGPGVDPQWVEAKEGAGGS